MNFKDQVVVVTGGAVGIGREISSQFAREGAIVVVNYHHSQTEAQELCATLQQEGHHVLSYQTDVADFKATQTMIDTIMTQFGHIDVLVNNSGMTRDNLILRMSEEEFDQVISTNLKGTWNMCKHVSKIMVKQRKGKIINITSVVGIVGNAGQTNYAASKAGIIGLTKSLAKELAKRNICVNAVAPGFIQTRMTSQLSTELTEEALHQIPLGRLGEPKDVAALALFLASPSADYITGQVIHVDGGMVMA